MSRSLPATYQPQQPDDHGALVDVDTVAEDNIVDNVHHCYGYWQPQLINTIFSGDIDAAGGVQPYVEGRAPGSKEVNGLWDFDLPPAPCDTLQIEVLVETTTGDNQTVRFDWASDPWISGGSPGTSVDMTIGGSSSQWTRVSGQISLPSGQDDDTLRMWAVNSGAAGEVRVHSVQVRAGNLSSIAAGPETEGGIEFIPMDTTEIGQDSPLPVAYRQALWDDCEFVRKTRPGHVLGWSENTHFRAGEEAYSETGSSYVRIITLPVAVPLGVTELRWSLVGYRAGTSGSVSLTTLTDAAAGAAAEEVSLNSGWASPYTGNLHRYDDGGQGSLTVTPPDDPATPENWAEEIRIEIEGDGASAVYLLSLCLWFAPETT